VECKNYLPSFAETQFAQKKTALAASELLLTILVPRATIRPLATGNVITTHVMISVTPTSSAAHAETPGRSRRRMADGRAIW